MEKLVNASGVLVEAALTELLVALAKAEIACSKFKSTGTDDCIIVWIGSGSSVCYLITLTIKAEDGLCIIDPSTSFYHAVRYKNEPFVSTINICRPEWADLTVSRVQYLLNFYRCNSAT